MRKFLPLALLVALSAPAVAQIPAPAPHSGKSQAKQDPLDRIICRTEEGTGSRLNKEKVCMTAREWKDLQDENQAALQKLQQQSSAVVPSG